MLSVGENLAAGVEVGTIAAFDADQDGPIFYYIQGKRKPWLARLYVNLAFHFQKPCKPRSILVNQAFNSTFHSKKLGKPGLNRVNQA